MLFAWVNILFITVCSSDSSEIHGENEGWVGGCFLCVCARACVWGVVISVMKHLCC
jgi:hypothetical protein